MNIIKKLKEFLKSVLNNIKFCIILTKNFLNRPLTINYPKVKPKIAKEFRGKLNYYRDKCIGCGLCVTVCPVGAIKLTKKRTVEIDLGICIFCGECTAICPKKAISFTNEFQNAVIKREELILK